MRKNLLAALIPWLCLTFLQAQDPSATQNTNTKSYLVWVNSTASNVRYLWDITDSTITVGSSKKRSDMRLKTYTAEQVKWVKFRQKGSVGRGAFLGVLAGATVGFISGFSQGDDDPANFISITAEAKGTMLAIPGAVGGAIIGCLIGCIKTKIPINNSRNTLTEQRKVLEKYKRGQ